MYNEQIYKEPFWAENSGFITGRDPLGIQNSSIALYSRLLPGMTNLTQRLRYYGFYCWMLKEYKINSIGMTDRSLESHYNFIRRGELILAYVMVNTASSELNVVGSNYANKNIKQVDEQGIYNIEKGADKLSSTPKGSVYWDYSSGALGQYYIGSLISLALVETNDKFFVLTDDKGVPLSNHFENRIDELARITFLNAIKNGLLTKKDIEILEPFALQNIQEKTAEWDYYIMMLLDPDGFQYYTSEKIFTSNRKDSIRLYLEFIKDGKKEFGFVAYQYWLKLHKLESSETNLGWYYYYINEAFHYAIATIFWVFLTDLEGKNLPINIFVENLSKVISEQICIDIETTEDEKIESILNKISVVDLISNLNHLEELTKSKENNVKAGSKAINLIFQIYLSIYSDMDMINSFENKNYINFQKGNISEHSYSYVTKFLSFKIRNYVSEIIKLIINKDYITLFHKVN